MPDKEVLQKKLQVSVIISHEMCIIIISGLKYNEYSSDFDSVVTMESLFM